jgi:superfamily II DNA/RNA helicase
VQDQILNCFDDFKLHPLILQAVRESGYQTPTPVQARAIPALLEGADLLVSSQTGSGKTAAFMLPALHKLALPASRPGRGPRMLVLSPTRELAAQTTAAAQKYGRHLRQINVVSVLGGMPYPLQNRMLAKPHEILIATPGRLIDQMQRGRVDFSRLEMLVLDEADRMLDMGFIEAVEQITAATPKTRQTLLFSATLDSRIATLAKHLLNQPVRIETTATQAQHENIEQRLHYVNDMAHKNRLLDHLLRTVELKQAIVFIATKRDCDTLAGNLADQGHSVAALHGDMNQSARTRTLTGLRNGRLRVLVATDVAARGIDVPGITHVINYDLPKQAEDYVHRIGRTGRAGNQGTAISFASARDGIQLKRIERFTGHSIVAHEIVGLEPRPRSRATTGERYTPGGMHNRRPGSEAHSPYAADRARRSR